MRPFRIRALTAALALALMLFAAVPASADPGDGGVPTIWSFPGDGGVDAFPGDGGVDSFPGDGGVE